jgi:transcriptional regulator with XRE-family HTH domain
MASSSVVRDVGRRIRQLRQSRSGPKLTQEALGERAKISVSFLSMIERGERSPHLETLAKIAQALEVPLADLLRDGSEGQPPEAMFKPLLEACRKASLGKRDVERLVQVVRSLYGA